MATVNFIQKSSDGSVIAGIQDSAIIDLTGKIGIGVTVPIRVLDVWAPTTEAIIRLNNTTAGDGETSNIEFSMGGGTNAQIVAEQQANGGFLRLFVRQSGGSLIERMTFDNAGNIGIGNATP
ncbi:unnamed protein product, partial [marine sediment metagenome]